MAELWPCGHLAGAVCAECFNRLKKEVLLLRKDVDYLKAESRYFETRTTKKNSIQYLIIRNAKLSKLLDSRIDRIREITTELDILKSEFNSVYRCIAELSDGESE